MFIQDPAYYARSSHSMNQDIIRRLSLDPCLNLHDIFSSSSMSIFGSFNSVAIEYFWQLCLNSVPSDSDVSFYCRIVCSIL